MLSLVPDMLNDVKQLSERVVQNHFAQLKSAFDTASQSPENLMNLWLQLSAQILVLIVLFSALLIIANRTTAWLSSIQRSTLKQISDPRFKRLTIELLWVIKPNVPWVLILSVSHFGAAVMPASWFLIKLIGPMGLAYATFRAIKVVVEWVLNRTHARGGQFISNMLSEQLCRLASSFSLQCTLILICFKFLSYTDLLIYFVGLSLLGVLWFRLICIASNYPFLIAKKLKMGLSFQDKKTTHWAHAFTFKLFAPVLFVLAFTIDLLDQLHQRLLNLDTYRLFHTKLVRAQLERKSEGQKEEPNTEQSSLSYAARIRREPEKNSLLPQRAFLQKIKQPLESWRKEQTDDNVLLLVADQGMGKTTMLNQLESECDFAKVVRLKIEEKVLKANDFFCLLANALETNTMEEISDLVNHDACMEPTVVLVDGAHNLFLSEVGCFEAYRCLLNCVNAHLQHIFWVVSINSLSWAYLKQVFLREQKFALEINLPRWSAEEIRKLIMGRHKSTHHRLSFNDLLFSASASSESSSIRSADSRVFNILWEQSNGNPEVAIALWIKAIKVEGFRLEVGVPQCPSSTPLKTLSDDLCFVYAAIMAHRFLSTKEIIKVTHLTEAIVRHGLKQGVNMGLIQRDDRGCYEICITWYLTLHQHLLSKNMLTGF